MVERCGRGSSSSYARERARQVRTPSCTNRALSRTAMVTRTRPRTASGALEERHIGLENPPHSSLSTLFRTRDTTPAETAPASWRAGHRASVHGEVPITPSSHRAAYRRYSSLDDLRARRAPATARETTVAELTAVSGRDLRG